MNKFAEKIVSFLEKRGVINEKNRAIYVYGADNALYTIVSTFGLLMVGLLFRRVPETIILIGLFYINQSTGGGYHAKTHMRCFLTMVAGLLVYLVMLRLPYNELFCVLVSSGAIAVLICFPLVLHPNKKYLLKKSGVLSRRSRFTVLVQAAIYVMLLVFRYASLIQCVSLGLGICALSRLVAFIIDKRKEKGC